MNILVTGANGNIGQAIVGHYANGMYHKTHGIGRGKQLGYYVPNKYTQLDLTNWDAVNLFCRDCEKFDLVAICHGVQVPCELRYMNENTYEHVVKNNLDSAVALVSNLIQHGRLQDGALVVLCSSIQANAPRAGRGAYGVAKAGLEVLAKTIAAESDGKFRAVALRLGQLTDNMKGINFSDAQMDYIHTRCYTELVKPIDVARFIDGLYYQKAMTGCVIDFDSGHGRNIW